MSDFLRRLRDDPVEAGLWGLIIMVGAVVLGIQSVGPEGNPGEVVGAVITAGVALTIIAVLWYTRLYLLAAALGYEALSLVLNWLANRLEAFAAGDEEPTIYDWHDDDEKADPDEIRAREEAQGIKRRSLADLEEEYAMRAAAEKAEQFPEELEPLARAFGAKKMSRRQAERALYALSDYVIEYGTEGLVRLAVVTRWTSSRHRDRLGELMDEGQAGL